MATVCNLIIPGKAVPNNTKSWYDKKACKTKYYKPAAVLKYQDTIRKILGCYFKWKTPPLISGPVIVTICINKKIPVSYSKKKRESLLKGLPLGAAPAICKPDNDNCMKVILDAISKSQWNNGPYILENDSQAFQTHSSKYYSYTECVTVKVETFEY